MSDTDIPLLPRPVGCPVPLTAFQLRVWNRLITNERALSERMCGASVRVLGPLDVGLLRWCIDAVVERHESLRTRIVSTTGTPGQHIDPACGDHVEAIDLSKVPPVHLDREAKRLAEEFMQKKIDLSAGPLFGARLLRLSDHEHALILAVDHMVSDGVSCEILAREIWTLYKQATQRQPFSLPQLPIQFADYAVWQQRTYEAWKRAHEPYWRGRLTGAPRVQLPLDHSLSAVREPVFATMHLPFGKRLSTRLRELARREGALLPLVVLTVYVAVMAQWCNQRDLVLGFVSHGRHRRPELESMIGFLANLLHFRIEIAKEDSFIDLLKRVNREFYSAYQHQDFDRVPHLIPEVSAELYFNWLPTNWIKEPAQREAEMPVRVRRFPIRLRPADNGVDDSFKCVAACADTVAGLVMTVFYRADLLAPRTIERLGQHLRLVAEEVAGHPHGASAAVVNLFPRLHVNP